jgi:hypothetical protein
MLSTLWTRSILNVLKANSPWAVLFMLELMVVTMAPSIVNPMIVSQEVEGSLNLPLGQEVLLVVLEGHLHRLGIR